MNDDAPIYWQIIQITRDTAASGPMWRCKGTGGRDQSVNAFIHYKERMNTFSYFEQAGYAEILGSMEVGQTHFWTEHPIQVEVYKSEGSKYYDLVNVEPRPEDAVPDSDILFDIHETRRGASRWAQWILGQEFVAVDFEATGAYARSRIIQAGATDARGEELLNIYIQPPNLERVEDAFHIHGITKEMVSGMPTFAQSYYKMLHVLQGRTWMGYNIEFDAQIAGRECTWGNLPPFFIRGLLDAAVPISRYLGDYDQERQIFRMPKLTVACFRLGVDATGAHDAVNDCVMTINCLRRVAEGAPIGDPPPTDDHE